MAHPSRGTPRLRGASTALLLVCGLSAQTASAQSAIVSAGGGIGVTQSENLSGRGTHVQAALTVLSLSELLPVSDAVYLRIEGLYQWGDLSAGPGTCELVPPEDRICLGRSEENRLLGGDVHLQIFFDPVLGSLRPYLKPLGGGIYSRRTEITETEFLQGDDSFVRFQEQQSVVSPGWTTGGGVSADLGGVGAFIEVRLHDLFEPDGSIAGALFVSAGLSL